MVTALLAAVALSPSRLQTPDLGSTLVSRIQTSLSVLGATHQALQDKFGRPDVAVEGSGVWVYGPWTPSPRMGFNCGFFKEVDGARVLADGVQFVDGSVGKRNDKTLTVAQSIFGDNLSDADKTKGGTHTVPRDFSWTSDEKTADVLTTLKAENIQYFAQQSDPRYVLATCTVNGQNVYVFSRQIDGDTIVPAFRWDVKDGSKTVSPNFDAAKLDAFSFSVGLCSMWHYTAGFSQEKIVGPGSYADTSFADDKWVKLGS